MSVTAVQHHHTLHTHDTGRVLKQLKITHFHVRYKGRGCGAAMSGFDSDTRNQVIGSFSWQSTILSFNYLFFPSRFADLNYT